MGHINKNPFVPQGADTQHEGRASPYDPNRLVENHLQGEAVCTDNSTQAPATNMHMTNV